MLQGVQRPGKPGNVREFRCKEIKSGKSQGKVREFCCVRFIFGRSEHLNFETFLGKHPPNPLQTVLDTHKNMIVVWKSQGISSLLEPGHPVMSTDRFPCPR